MTQSRFKVGEPKRVHIGQGPKLTGSSNQRRVSVNIPPTLHLWCNERGLESPGPGNPHLFAVFCLNAETQFRDKIYCLSKDRSHT